MLSWRISDSMDASFCVDCLENALRSHGTPPEVFNSDQGSQFTSEAFTGVLKREGVTTTDTREYGCSVEQERQQRKPGADGLCHNHMRWKTPSLSTSKCFRPPMA